MSSATISIVYDNRTMNNALQGGFGFSCIVDFGSRKILFDTGGNGNAFFANMQRLGIGLNTITHAVFSHKHWDHTAAFDKTLERLKPKTPLYLPSDFDTKLEAGIPKHIVTHKIAKFQEIDKDIFSLVLRGRYLCFTTLQEQALILRTPKGLVVLTGCAHPGIETIARIAKEYLGGPIYLLLGGFHLHHSWACTSAKVVRKIRDLDVINVAPCHCTGNTAITQFQKEYGDNFIHTGTGTVIHI